MAKAELKNPKFSFECESIIISDVDEYAEPLPKE